MRAVQLCLLPVLTLGAGIPFASGAGSGAASAQAGAAAGSTGAAPSRPDRASQATLRTALDSIVQRRANADSFSGVVLVTHDMTPVYQRAVGLANRQAGIPIRLDTKLQVASVTKLYTQIAIRQLEQAGKLKLSDTLGKFLPSYPNPVVRSRVTVELLLQHRSGVGSFWNERFMARRANIRSIRDYMELFQNDSLLFEPGTSQAYSNGGYVLLGAIIEQASGQSYHDYLREHVFKPAGMTNTMPFDRRVVLSNAAVGYTAQMLGGPLPGDQRLAGPGPRPGYESAPTGDQSSAQPQLRLIGPDGKPMSQEEIRQARAQRTAQGGARQANTSMQPGMSSPAGDYYSTVGDFLKLARALIANKLLDADHTGALLGPRFASGGEFRSNGGGPGVNAEFSVFANGYVLIVLANYDPPAATAVAQPARALLGSLPGS